jgi:outer membrane receptor protein involved in Fe transport
MLWVTLGALGLSAELGGPARAQDYTATVRAPTVPVPRRDPAAVTIIEVGLPGQTDQPSPYKTSLAELLVGQPGVQVRASGGLGQFSGALLRGAAPNQVAVLLDGVPLSRGSQATVDLSLLPIAGLERVEIYRGAPPLELGVDAIGGVINLITRRGQSAPTGWATLGSGSFGRRVVNLGYSGERPGLRVSASASYQGAVGDFPYYFNEGLHYGKTDLPQLYRRNDDFDQGAVDLRVSLGDESRGGFVQASGLLKRQGVAGIGQPGAQPGAPELQTGRALLSAGGQGTLAGGHVVLSGDAHGLLEQSRFRDLAVRPVSLFAQLSEQSGARLVLRLHRHGEKPAAPRPLTQLSLIALVEARYERLTQSDLCSGPTTPCQAAPASQRARVLLGLGGELRLWNDRLLVQPGGHLLIARSDGLTPTAPGAATDPAVFPAPRLALRVQVLPWLLARLSGGRFVRLPTFLELFGDGAFFRPSLGLRPESAWTAEAGLQASATPQPGLWLALAAHGYYRHLDDLIDILRDGPTLHARNVGAAQTAGVELEARARLGDALQAQVNYTFLDARDQTTDPNRNGRLLPGRAPHTVFLRLDGGYRTIRLFYELDHAAELYQDPANLQPRPARTLHALGLQLGPQRLGRLRVQLAVEVRNLLDTRLVLVTLPLAPEHGLVPVPLTDYFDYPLPGRALYATLSARL